MLFYDKLYWKERQQYKSPAEFFNSSNNNNTDAQSVTMTTTTTTIATTTSNAQYVNATASAFTLQDVEDFIFKNICQVDEAQDYFVDSANIGKAFNKVQHFVSKYIKSSYLNYQEHVQHMLSLSSILLVTRKTHPDFSDCGSYTTMLKLKRKHGMMEGNFPSAVLIQSIENLNQLKDEVISRNEACLQFYQMPISQSNSFQL